MDIPFGNIVTGLATVVAVVIANKLSSTQSERAKLWELRRQAYGVILSELRAVEGLCASADECIQEDAQRYFHDGASNSVNERIWKHMTVLQQRFSDDYLSLSNDFISRFEALLGDLGSGRPDDAPDEEHEAFSKAIRKHRPLLLAQGRKEVAAQR